MANRKLSLRLKAPVASVFPVESPHELSDYLRAFSAYSATTSGLRCFRGQKSDAWDSVAGLFRPDLQRLADNEKRAVRDLISVHPQEFDPDQSMFDQLVRMQHYGLPTRLLDVSLNPLVSLFFACNEEEVDADGVVWAFDVPEDREKYYDSDSVSCISNLANLTTLEKDNLIKLRNTLPKLGHSKADIVSFNRNEIVKRLHQFIKVEKPYFLPIIRPIDLFKPYFVHPKRSNRRIVAQSGAFIIYGLPPTKRINFAQKIAERKFIVPKSMKTHLRSQLAEIGITESSLYPEIDKAAKRIADHYRD